MDGRLLAAVRQADGSRLDFAYDGEGRMFRVTLPDGSQNKYEYDDRGYLIRASGEGSTSIELPPDASRAGVDTKLLAAAGDFAATVTTPDESFFRFTMEHGRLARYVRGGAGLRILDAGGVLRECSEFTYRRDAQGRVIERRSKGDGPP